VQDSKALAIVKTSNPVREQCFVMLTTCNRYSNFLRSCRTGSHKLDKTQLQNYKN